MLECPNHTINHEFKFLLGHIENSHKMVFNSGFQELKEVNSMIRVAVKVLRD